MAKRLFKAKRGQVDYTHIRWAPVINCVLKHKNRILLVQRSKDLRLFPGYWNGISGFLDDNRSLTEKVIKEELGISGKSIRRMRFGRILEQDDPKHKKTWIIHPIR
jgi:isopentenyldiphosphate isomerase